MLLFARLCSPHLFLPFFEPVPYCRPCLRSSWYVSKATVKKKVTGTPRLAVPLLSAPETDAGMLVCVMALPFRVLCTEMRDSFAGGRETSGSFSTNAMFHGGKSAPMCPKPADYALPPSAQRRIPWALLSRLQARRAFPRLIRALSERLRFHSLIAPWK